MLGYVVDLRKQLCDAFEFAKEYQRKAQDRNITMAPEEGCDIPQAGGLVLQDLRTVGDASRRIGAKLAPQYAEPFVIARCLGHRDYELRYPGSEHEAGVADQLTSFRDRWKEGQPLKGDECEGYQN